MSADLLREAATLMRQRAEAATDGGFGWHIGGLAGGNEIWAHRDAAGYDSWMVATTATRLNPNPGTTGLDDATHIASWHPAVALAVADLLDTAADHGEVGDYGPDEWDALTAVARAYLGGVA